jgi:hypothetical protein
VDRSQLSKAALERECADVLTRLGATCEETGKYGLVDLVVRFDLKSFTLVFEGEPREFFSRAELAIEVKSHERCGALVADARQALDWRGRLRGRRERTVRASLEQGLAAMSCPGDGCRLRGDVETYLYEDPRVFVHGVLVANVWYAQKKRKAPFESNVRGFARAHDLILVDWMDLLAIEADVEAGKHEAIDVWASLLRARGSVWDPADITSWRLVTEPQESVLTHLGVPSAWMRNRKQHDLIDI